MSARLAAGSPSTPVALQAAATASAPAAAEPRDELAPAAFDTGPDGELKAERDAPVGGQAVLEGVMMRGVSNWAVAVSKPTAEQLGEGERSPTEPALGEVEVSVFPLD